MQYSDRWKLVWTILFVSMFAPVSRADEPTIENAAVSQEESLSHQIDLVAGQAPARNQQPDQFTQLLDQAIEITSKRTLTANAHSPWQIFHCILAMRRETVLRLGNEKVNAIDWLSTAEPQFDNQPWLLKTPHGAKFHSYTRKYAFEGHPSQFLALLSHSNLPMDFEFHVQGEVVTLTDLVNNTMKEVNTAEEVTWVLWALQHFLKPDAVWVNHANETWSIERLVQIESAAPVVGTPCGGNHRLFALTRARDKYLQSGGKLRGAWHQADLKIRQHIEIARSLQNPDGSFSSDWYKGANYTTDVNPRFNSTGHTMEFLAASLPNERLNEPWVRNAVWMLSRELIQHRDTQIDCGPLFHSLDALILYRDRIRPKEPVSEIASQPSSKPPVAMTILPPEPEIGSSADPKLANGPAKPVRKVETITKLPTEIKPGTPDAQPVPLPIPEASAVPAKMTPPKPATPGIRSPQASLPKVNLPTTAPVAPSTPTTPTTPTTKLSNDSTKITRSSVPQIDPSKLPNVGQAAAPRKPAGPITEPKRTARSKRPVALPPALLPDLSATPVSLPGLPVVIPDLQPGTINSDAAGEPIELEKVPMQALDDLMPTGSSTESVIESDEAISALEPANRVI